MDDPLDYVKTTIKDHPTETVAIIAAVTLFGVLFYYKSKEKKVAVRRAHCKCPKPQTWWTRMIRRQTQPRYVLEFAS